MVRISCIEAQDAFGLLLNHTGEKDNQVSHTHTHVKFMQFDVEKEKEDTLNAKTF